MPGALGPRAIRPSSPVAPTRGAGYSMPALGEPGGTIFVSTQGDGIADPFADDLSTGRGIVLGRAATKLRSIEIQPLTGGSTDLRSVESSESRVEPRPRKAGKPKPSPDQGMPRARKPRLRAERKKKKPLPAEAPAPRREREGVGCGGDSPLGSRRVVGSPPSLGVRRLLGRGLGLRNGKVPLSAERGVPTLSLRPATGCASARVPRSIAP